MTDVEFIHELVRRELGPMGVEVIQRTPNMPIPQDGNHVTVAIEAQMDFRCGVDVGMVILLTRFACGREIYRAAKFDPGCLLPTLISRAVVEMAAQIEEETKREKRNAIARARYAAARRTA
jgi:hypothetical protein